jgi:hypothetical protein
MKYPLKREREYRDEKVISITALTFAYETENTLIKLRCKQMREQLFERLHLSTTHNVASITGLIKGGPLLFHNFKH